MKVPELLQLGPVMLFWQQVVKKVSPVPVSVLLLEPLLAKIVVSPEASVASQVRLLMVRLLVVPLLQAHLLQAVLLPMVFRPSF